jgi:hypothetical protein
MDAKRQQLEALRDQDKEGDQEGTQPPLPGEYFRLKGVTYRVQNLQDFRELNQEILKKVAKIKEKQLAIASADEAEHGPEGEDASKPEWRQTHSTSVLKEPPSGERTSLIASALGRQAEYERS